MLLIKCPYCQEQLEEADFSYAGEAFIERPKNPEKLTDEQWANYVFFRHNHKGEHYEQWQHAVGCRKYFIVKRNTIDNTIINSFMLEEASQLK